MNMQDIKTGATRAEQIEHHATEFVAAIDEQRAATNQAAKDEAQRKKFRRQRALEKAVKNTIPP